MRVQSADIDGYIAGSPSDTRQQLEQIRSLVLEIAPDAVESVSYAMPTFKLNGHVLIYGAAFKKHIGLYPAPIALEHFKTDLEPYKATEGTVQFLRTQALPLGVIARIVRFRVGQALSQPFSRSSQALRASQRSKRQDGNGAFCSHSSRFWRIITTPRRSSRSLAPKPMGRWE